MLSHSFEYISTTSISQIPKSEFIRFKRVGFYKYGYLVGSKWYSSKQRSEQAKTKYYASEKRKERKIEIKKSKMLVSLGITKEQYERDIKWK